MNPINPPRFFTVQINAPGAMLEGRCYYISELPIGRAMKFFGLQKTFQNSPQEEQGRLMLEMFSIIMDGLTQEQIENLIPYDKALEIMNEAGGELSKKENSHTPITLLPESAGTD